MHKRIDMKTLLSKYDLRRPSERANGFLRKCGLLKMRILMPDGVSRPRHALVVLELFDRIL